MPPKDNLEFQNYCRKCLQSDLGVPTINREEDFQCGTQTKDLKLSPHTTLLASYTIHQSTAMPMKIVISFPKS